jgi:hypothetical protein
LTARARLLARIGDINDLSRPRPLVTIDEFFDGNDDYGSIGYNLPDPPDPQEFYRLLSTIAAQPEVGDVRIEVKDLEDPDGWPATDTIWIFTTASPDAVRGWFPERLAPDEWWTPEDIEHEVEPYSPPPGMQAVLAFYD